MRLIDIYRGGGGCLDCGGTCIPIVYGFPSAALFAAAERGEVRLGGCMPDMATRACSQCGATS